MSVEAGVTVRAARRQDTASLSDLRIACLAEMARLQPRLELLPDVRARVEHALPVWVEQENRTLLVAQAPAVEDAPAALVGYASGVAAVWPPVFRNQHVGEVCEIYVVPGARGGGVGHALLKALTQSLRSAGSVVLRAPVPVGNTRSLARFRDLGFSPVHYVVQRGLEEG